MSDSKSTSGGVGFLGLLAIAFIVLKLCKVIDWSWWYVTCPLWGPVALLLTGLLVWLPFWYFRKKKKMNSQLREAKENKSRWQQRLEELQQKQKNL